MVVELTAEELERRYNRRMSAFLDFHTPSDHESDVELERPITAVGNFAFDSDVVRVHRRTATSEGEGGVAEPMRWERNSHRERTSIRVARCIR